MTKKKFIIKLLIHLIKANQIRKPKNKNNAKQINQ